MIILLGPVRCHIARQDDPSYVPVLILYLLPILTPVEGCQQPPWIDASPTSLPHKVARPLLAPPLMLPDSDSYDLAVRTYTLDSALSCCAFAYICRLHLLRLCYLSRINGWIGSDLRFGACEADVRSVLITLMAD